MVGGLQNSKKNRSYDELENKRNWAWLNNKPCFDYNMGSERQSRLLEDFEKVKNQCNSLGLILPNSFIDFFNTPTYWQKFLSSNDGFFYLDKSVIFCPADSNPKCNVTETRFYLKGRSKT